MFYKNVIFSMMEFIKGTSIQKYLRWLNKTQWLKPEELKRIQNKKLRALVKHAYENVPYYHHTFRVLNLKPDDIKSKDDLQKVPILTKEMIRKNFSDLIAVNMSRSRFIETRSSGSTGKPLRFFIDKKAYSHGWAQTFRCWSWAGFSIGDPYVKIGAEPRTKFWKKLQDRLMNCLYIPREDIFNAGDYWIKKMKDKRPKIIRGYPSYIYILAKIVNDMNVDINPNAVMTTGEILTPQYRDTIEEAFNCKVFDCYGGEATPIAFECELHKSYHICDEIVIVEVVKGNEMADIGEIVITNLDNYVMPFIRYKIQDLGRMGNGVCPCGRGLSLLDSIEGRTGSIVLTPNGRILLPLFFTDLFRNLNGINQFQIIQNNVNKIKIKIVKNEKFTYDELRFVVSKLKSVDAELDITVEFVDEIPPLNSGKTAIVISKFSIEDAWRFFDG